MPSPNEESIERARRALVSWMGAEPDATLTVPGATGGPSVAVLTFVDEDEEGEDERTTFLATAGLHRRATEQHPGGAELVLCVAGDVEGEEVGALAAQLGDVARLLVEGEGEVIEGARIGTPPLEVFEDMSVLLLARWGQEGETLEGTDPPIRLLSANPLYEDEAEAMEGMSEEAALAWLDEQEVEVDDPLRAPAVVAAPPAFAEAMAAFAGGSSFDVTQAMQQVVKGMEEWIRENAPELEASDLSKAMLTVQAEEAETDEPAAADVGGTGEKPSKPSKG